jgi:hypothetical protein
VGDVDFVKEGVGGDEGDGADRAVGGGDRGGVVGVEFFAKEEEAVDGHHSRHQNRREHGEGDFLSDAAFGEFDAAFEADREQ